MDMPAEYMSFIEPELLKGAMPYKSGRYVRETRRDYLFHFSCREEYLYESDHLRENVSIFHANKVKPETLYSLEDHLKIPRSKIHDEKNLTTFIPNRKWRTNIFTWGLYASICREAIRSTGVSWEKTSDFRKLTEKQRAMIKVFWSKGFADNSDELETYICFDDPTMYNCFYVLGQTVKSLESEYTGEKFIKWIKKVFPAR